MRELRGHLEIQNHKLQLGQNFYDQALFNRAFRVTETSNFITPPEVRHAFTNLCQSMARERTDHAAITHMHSLIAHRPEHLRQYFPIETRNSLTVQKVRTVLHAITEELENYPLWWKYVNQWVNSLTYQADGTHNLQGSRNVAPLYETWLREEEQNR